ALWLIGLGLLSGIASSIAGFFDFVSVRPAREQISSWSHMLAAIFALSLALANFLIRWHDPIGGVLPWGLLLSANTAAMVTVTGWIGGNLTFRHLIGSYIEEEEAKTLAAIRSESSRES